MKRDDVIATLRQHRAALEERGVMHAAVFGSVARGEETPESDIDIMVELDPARQITVYDYLDIKDMIEDFFPDPTDVINRDGLLPYAGRTALRDSLPAF